MLILRRVLIFLIRTLISRRAMILQEYWSWKSIDLYNMLIFRKAFIFQRALICHLDLLYFYEAGEDAFRIRIVQIPYYPNTVLSKYRTIRIPYYLNQDCLNTVLSEYRTIRIRIFRIPYYPNQDCPNTELSEYRTIRIPYCPNSILSEHHTIRIP